jgi:tRNA(adenine34) deaminase
LSEHDRKYLKPAIRLALEAGIEGNLPVGAVIVLDGEIISEGKNTVWIPALDATRHAEIEALRSVPSELWDHATEMTLYTTLEPCVMCLGAILLHGVGRVVFGSSEDYGGASSIVESLPRYFRDKMNSMQWVGPALAEECDPLHKRLLELEADRR